jgi:phosphoribosylformylglycinamidine cyclo-ligase
LPQRNATVSYKDAGVDIDAGNEFVKNLKKLCPDIGGFGGLYPLGSDFLVASADGVGTKLKLAFAEDRHNTIGIDLVAMCVNDIITLGARPLFFLDYFSTSKLNVPQAEQVLKGIHAGCL